MKKRTIVMISTLCILTIIASGCGQSAASDISTTIEQTMKDAQEASSDSETTYTVKVTAINGGIVTADTGTITEGDYGNRPGGRDQGDNPQGVDGPGGRDQGDNPQGVDGQGGRDQGDNPQGVDGQGGRDQGVDGQGGRNQGDNPPPRVDDIDKNSGATSDNQGQNNSKDNQGRQGGSEGDQPSGAPGKINEFTTDGDNISFEIEDDTTITLEMLQGSSEGSIDDIVTGSILEVTLEADNTAKSVIVKNLAAGGGFGGSGEVTQGTSAYTIDKDESITGESYSSSGDDENALRVDGAVVTLSDISVDKTGGESSNTEDGDFYGQNAGLLVTNKATADITGAVITTDAVNGNGVFSYGDGTTVNISDSTIHTLQNNSGGIQTTGGGTTNATNLDVHTEGDSAAAIRSDRGGGTVKVNGGKYSTAGTGSPVIYSTADISVSDAALTAGASEGVVIEGKNSVSLINCDVTSSMENTYNGDNTENIHAIMIYQSMSGDADMGEASFSAEGGSVTANKGDMFYITNTDCAMSLNSVNFVLANDVFLRIEGNSSSRGWGTEGANGGDVTLDTTNQTIEGNILVDEISSLKLNMANSSSLIGTIGSSDGTGDVELSMDDTSSWKLTGDSYVKSIEGDMSQIDTNGYTLYVDGVAMK